MGGFVFACVRVCVLGGLLACFFFLFDWLVPISMIDDCTLRREIHQFEHQCEHPLEIS